MAFKRNKRWFQNQLKKDPNKHCKYKKGQTVLFISDTYIPAEITAIRYADNKFYFKIRIEVTKGTINVVEVDHERITKLIPYWRWWLRQKFWFLVA